jgi:hypothetical protein
MQPNVKCEGRLEEKLHVNNEEKSFFEKIFFKQKYTGIF